MTEHRCLCDLPDDERIEPDEDVVALSEPMPSADDKGFSVRTDVRSANYGNAPGHPQQMVSPPKGIMLHHTAGSKDGDLATLTRSGTWVSSNDYITKEPQIFELVPHPRRAWHAGTADAGTGYVSDGNTVYWGIEIENQGSGRDPYPARQIDAIVWRCRQLRKRWGLTSPSQLFRHRDFAPSRKSDPSNNFPFAEVRRRVFAASDPTDPPATKPTPSVLYRVRAGSFRERDNADALVAWLKSARFTGLAVPEGGAYNVYAGSFSVKANADRLAGDLRAKGFEAVVVQKGASPRPSPTKPPVDNLARDVEAVIAFGRDLLGTPYGTGWEEGTWPDLSPLYARIGKSDPASYYRRYPIVCSGLINVLRYEVAGLPAIGRKQGDPYPGGTAAIGRTLARMNGCKPYPPVENTPRGWLVFAPYLGSRLALQGHVGVALGDGRVLEARVPAVSENRTEDQGSRHLVSGGGRPYTTIIPPSLWLRV